MYIAVNNYTGEEYDFLTRNLTRTMPDVSARCIKLAEKTINDLREEFAGDDLTQDDAEERVVDIIFNVFEDKYGEYYNDPCDFDDDWENYFAQSKSVQKAVTRLAKRLVKISASK